MVAIDASAAPHSPRATGSGITCCQLRRRDHLNDFLHTDEVVELTVEIVESETRA
ncbi:hypothetical protein [Ciceribacter lividus]|uniref:hypothetical protein n=1 Tax=Ciceribacter lividus TaxID=1197950 RepID=UPI001473E0F0|nr:hypothetical protein [Ciceribacter lividus]